MAEITDLLQEKTNNVLLHVATFASYARFQMLPDPSGYSKQQLINMRNLLADVKIAITSFEIIYDEEITNDS